MEAAPLKSESKTIPSLARAATAAPQAPPPSSSLPRQVLVQSRRKRFVEERLTHTKPTNAKSPLVFSPKFAGKISPQLFKVDTGYGHCPIKAKENPEDTENLIPSSNGTDVNSSTCFTPFKTAFGTPSKLQTPSSKSLSLSISGNKQCPHSAGGGSDKAVHSITQPPFRSLAKRNLGTCLFSPASSSTTLLPASPVAFEKLLSPAIKGLPKRVFLQFSSPARRVPVYQKGSHPIIKHSPFETPKSSRTGQTKRGSCQNDDVIDDNVMQHHDNNDHNDDDNVKQGRKNLEGLLKRVLVLPPQLSTPARRVPVHHKESQPRGKPSSFRTPKSCRTGGRKQGPCKNDVDLLKDDLKQHYDGNGDGDGDDDGLLTQVEQLQTQVDCPVV